jgi:hypothetical protein
VARGTVAALVSVFVAAFSHAVAGGELPGAAGLVLCLAFSVLVCIALAGRRLPRTRLAASVAASQAMYHWLFGALGTGAIATGPVGGMSGHGHDASLGLHITAPHLHGQGDLLVAHIPAAVVTFLVLAFGERTIATPARLARALAVSLLPGVPDAPAGRPPTRLSPTGLRSARPRHRLVDHSGLRHRGPPTASFA